MRTITFLLFVFIIQGYTTQWQQPVPLDIAISSPSFNSDNTIMYCSVYYSTYHVDIAYYFWDGSSWTYGGRVVGDINTDHDEDEPFITYDSQQLYYMRTVNQTGQPYHIWMATWNGLGFYNLIELGAQINSADCRYPSLTQDEQKLYFCRSVGGLHKIFESTWNGSDWGTPILLPAEINEGGGIDRFNVTISPDGNELYFTGAGSYPSRLAYSRKIGGVWQQWQYCDWNINQVGSSVGNEALTYAPYETQELYFARTNSPGTLTWHATRSPVSVEPASLGQIKASYAR